MKRDDFANIKIEENERLIHICVNKEEKKGTKSRERGRACVLSSKSLAEVRGRERENGMWNEVRIN
jgi:hypothetical protein